MKHHSPLQQEGGTRAALSPSRAAPEFPAVDVMATAEPFGYRVSRRLFDLVFGFLILLLIAPVVPLLAVMIRLDSPGPILYRQTRIGQGGRRFTFLKFRSMYAGSDRKLDELAALNEQAGPIFKMRDDPRITPVGRFLRRSSLDEIPQILNVLRGDMSIVGPRPALPAEVSKYEPWQRRRLEARPGLTCLWQISGRSHIGFDEWMRLDVEYLRTRSLWTDVVILAKTIPAVMARRGAY
ncbi:MAG: sugar transferase [Candidatus Krumholzibacteria bacterium]|nr:sugar transferase [Candidatus Krumholzibacteria bacterium]MDH4336388.1 sugar transferase [Candidatus Krumholzibacteria bacterium]MDH5269513.1 sugar transferase [Candidatus Krumholzibacteria bacterium]